MRLIVGLGNYPEKYALTRHNFGFLALEALAEKQPFTPFKLESKFKAQLSYGEIKGEKTILCKPQTLMNLSGDAVGPLMKFYKIPQDKLVVLTDDLDQDFGASRIRIKGSDGGQRGLRHITKVLGSAEFLRLKFGIKNEFRDRYEAADFVLGKFTAEEQSALKAVIAEGLEKLIRFDRFS
jgi:PTH1 family peptidyl-tRNA hydrolase